MVCLIERGIEHLANNSLQIMSMEIFVCAITGRGILIINWNGASASLLFRLFIGLLFRLSFVHKVYKYVKKTLNKYFHHHAGALENCSCVSSISAFPGGQRQHPVDHCFDWILAGACSGMLISSARMTTRLFMRLVQSFPNYRSLISLSAPWICKET